MDGLSAAASVIAVLQAAAVAIKYTIDFYKSTEDREKLVIELQSFRLMIKMLDDRRSNAQSGDRWCQGILELARTSGSLSAKWEYIPPPYLESEGALARLYKTVAKLMKKLNPDNPAHGMKKLGHSMKWHWDKDRFQSLFNDITRCREEIRFILDEDNFELLKVTREDGRETNIQVKETHVHVKDTSVHVKDTHVLVKNLSDRMVSFEDAQKTQEERHRIKEEHKQIEKDERERVEIEKWLSPLDFWPRQLELFENAFPTGQCLLDHVAFQHWVAGQPWFLQCYGKPGSGKTVLSSIVVNYLYEKFKNQNTPVICLYLDYKESRAQNLKNLLGSLLKQLIHPDNTTSIPPKLRELFRKPRGRKVEPRLEDIWEFLEAQMNTHRRVYLIVDALDQCSFRLKLLAEIRKLKVKNLSVMTTSRQIDSEDRGEVVDCDVCGALDVTVYYRCDTCKDPKPDMCYNCKGKNPCKEKSHRLIEPYEEVKMNFRIRDQDLEGYITTEMEKEIEGYGAKVWDERRLTSRPGLTRFGRKCQKDPELLKEIPTAIVEKADGRFLHAKLYMDSLRTRQTLRHIREALNTFPEDLNILYEETMKRILEQEHAVDRELGLKVLSIVVCTHRPLVLEELQHILAIEPGAADFEEDMDYDKEDILSSTAGLITIDGGSTVRLMHFTLHAYLNQPESRSRWFPSAEAGIANACLTYLNFGAFTRPAHNEEAFEAMRQKYPFIAYASQYWGTHVRDVGLDPDIQSKTVKLLDQPSRIAAYIQAAWFTDRGSAHSWDVRKGIDGLHVCAWFGLSSIIPMLDPKDLEVDVQEETYGQTPLMYACRSGHIEVVRQLLDLGASVNITSTRGRTPLFEAISEHHDDVVELLLTRQELNLSAVQPKNFDRTALMLAAHSGNSNIVELLLEHLTVDIINQRDSYGCTALFLATLKGDFATVKLLAQKPGINLDLVDNAAGRSALIIAATRNSSEIVELLLQNGANPMLKDYQGGGTAMLRAIDWGCIDVVKVMLKFHTVDLRCLDDLDRTLMHGASRGGWPDIILLLKGEGLDPRTTDKNGLSSLHEASRHGKSEAIKLLLELGVDSIIPDGFRRTPWTIAWQYGHLECMAILEGKKSFVQDKSKSIPDAENLPVWSFARLGFLTLIKYALAVRKHEFSEMEPVSNNTVLHCAIEAGHIDILRLLLLEDKSSVNDANCNLRTPLHQAAVCGHLDAVKLLLQNHAKLDREDKWGDSPLALAQGKGHYSIAILLIEKGAKINPRKIDIRRMLFAAIELESAKAVAILVHGGADVLSRNKEGTTALQLAKEVDNGEIRQLLQPGKSFYFKANKRPHEQANDGMNSMPSLTPQNSDSVVPFRPRPITG